MSSLLPMVGSFCPFIVDNKIAWAIGVSLILHAGLGGIGYSLTNPVRHTSGTTAFLSEKRDSFAPQALSVRLAFSTARPAQLQPSQVASMPRRSSVTQAWPSTAGRTNDHPSSADQGLLKKDAQEYKVMETHSARTPEKREDVALYQRYLEKVSRKIERVGTSLFPRNQYGKKVYGQLTVEFTLERNGKILQWQIMRSSGNHDIDQGARRIFQLAQPFDRCPEPIWEAVHSLTVTKTITFADEDRAVGVE